MAEAVTLTLLSQRTQLLSTASQDTTACLLNQLDRPAETVCLQIKAAGVGDEFFRKVEETQGQS